MMMSIAAVISVSPMMSDPMYGPNSLKCHQMSGLLETSGTIPSAPGAVILYDPAQRSITTIPMLVARKGKLRSSIHAANRVRPVLPAGENSSLLTLSASPEVGRLMFPPNELVTELPGHRFFLLKCL